MDNKADRLVVEMALGGSLNCFIVNNGKDAQNFLARCAQIQVPVDVICIEETGDTNCTIINQPGVKCALALVKAPGWLSKVLKQRLGKVLVCDNLNTCEAWAKRGYNCYTRSGESAMSSGVFAGGRINLNNYQKITLAAEKWTVQQEFEKAQAKREKCEGIVRSIVDEITKLEEDKRKFKHGTHGSRHELRVHRDEIARIEGDIAEVEEVISQLEQSQSEINHDIKRTREQVKRLKEEMATKTIAGLTASEQKQMDQLAQKWKRSTPSSKM